MKDLAIEAFRDKKEIFITGTHRISASVIEPKTTLFMTFPKELSNSALGCAIYNGLESQKHNKYNIVWRVG